MPGMRISNLCTRRQSGATTVGLLLLGLALAAGLVIAAAVVSASLERISSPATRSR